MTIRLTNDPSNQAKEIKMPEGSKTTHKPNFGDVIEFENI